MIKRVLILLTITTTLFGQNLLKSFKLGEQKMVHSEDTTPTSNSIQDIIANDDESFGKS